LEAVKSTLKLNYVVWRFKRVPDSCVLDELRGVPKMFQIRKGIPRAEGFPSDAKFTLDPDYPNDTLLADVFNNVYRMVVISPALKTFLQGRALLNVEFLPVTIIDHKSKPKASYFIIHPIWPVECLDLAASGARWDTVNKETIDTVERVILNTHRIDPGLQIFKIKYFYNYVLVRQDLADAITAEGFTGIEWVSTNEFKNL
jgi:hypothetical protein